MRTRLRAAWNCVLGRPTMYRVKIEGRLICEAHGYYADSHIDALGQDGAIQITSTDWPFSESTTDQLRRFVREDPNYAAPVEFLDDPGLR